MEEEYGSLSVGWWNWLPLALGVVCLAAYAWIAARSWSFRARARPRLVRWAAVGCACATLLFASLTLATTNSVIDNTFKTVDYALLQARAVVWGSKYARRLLAGQSWLPSNYHGFHDVVGDVLIGREGGALVGDIAVDATTEEAAPFQDVDAAAKPVEGAGPPTKSTLPIGDAPSAANDPPGASNLPAASNPPPGVGSRAAAGTTPAELLRPSSKFVLVPSAGGGTSVSSRLMPSAEPSFVGLNTLVRLSNSAALDAARLRAALGALRSSLERALEHLDDNAALARVLGHNGVSLPDPDRTALTRLTEQLRGQQDLLRRYALLRLGGAGAGHDDLDADPGVGERYAHGGRPPRVTSNPRRGVPAPLKQARPEESHMIPRARSAALTGTAIARALRAQPPSVMATSTRAITADTRPPPADAARLARIGETIAGSPNATVTAANPPQLSVPAQAVPDTALRRAFHYLAGTPVAPAPPPTTIARALVGMHPEWTPLVESGSSRAAPSEPTESGSRLEYSGAYTGTAIARALIVEAPDALASGLARRLAAQRSATESVSVGGYGQTDSSSGASETTRPATTPDQSPEVTHQAEGLISLANAEAWGERATWIYTLLLLSLPAMGVAGLALCLAPWGDGRWGAAFIWNACFLIGSLTFIANALLYVALIPATKGCGLVANALWSPGELGAPVSVHARAEGAPLGARFGPDVAAVLDVCLQGSGDLFEVAAPRLGLEPKQALFEQIDALVAAMERSLRSFDGARATRLVADARAAHARATARLEALAGDGEASRSSVSTKLGSQLSSLWASVAGGQTEGLSNPRAAGVSTQATTAPSKTTLVGTLGGTTRTVPALETLAASGGTAPTQGTVWEGARVRSSDPLGPDALLVGKVPLVRSHSYAPRRLMVSGDVGSARVKSTPGRRRGTLTGAVGTPRVYPPERQSTAERLAALPPHAPKVVPRRSLPAARPPPHRTPPAAPILGTLPTEGPRKPRPATLTYTSDVGGVQREALSRAAFLERARAELLDPYARNLDRVAERIPVLRTAFARALEDVLALNERVIFVFDHLRCDAYKAPARALHDLACEQTVLPSNVTIVFWYLTSVCLLLLGCVYLYLWASVDTPHLDRMRASLKTIQQTTIHV